MNTRKAAALGAAFVLTLSLACSATPGTPTVSFGAPAAATPDGAIYRVSEQPITLVLTNATRTGGATTRYTVEVAADASFSNVVWTGTDIEEGADGTTRVTIGTLAGQGTYFWRSRAVVDGVTGQPSPTLTFSLRPAASLGTPGTMNPESGAAVVAEQPTLTVANVVKTGTTGPIVYEFQISTSASFAPIAASGTAGEQPGQTSWTAPGTFAAGTYFWRVRATAPATGETGAFSAVVSFTLTPFSLKLATITNSPAGIVDWPEATKITLLEFRGGSEDVSGIRVEFSKKDGPGRWPDVVPPGWSGPLQYCLGMVLRINGRYYADAPVQMWNGRERGGGAPSLFARNWFYDSRWGPMMGYQPATGEMVGFFVVAGVTRDKGHGTGDLSPVKERSNVVFVPMPTDAGATFRFE